MEKRLRTNLYLAAVVAALVAFALIAPRLDEAPVTHALVDIGEDVSEIHVNRNGDPHLSLQRQSGTWKIVHPANLPADTFQVDALLESLHAPLPDRYPIEEVDTAELGLAQPEWTVSVNGKTLQVGNTTALGNRRYVRKDGHVYLVGEVLAYRLARPPWNYASKRLLPDDADIVSLALPGDIHIEKEGPSWKIVPPDTTLASDDLQKLVDNWRNARALSVSPAASVPRDGEVVLELAEGGSLRFGVELRETELLLSRDEPAVTYTLSAGARHELFLAPEPAESNGERE